jgi:hypothetical protein
MSDHLGNRWGNSNGTFDRGWYTSPPGVYIDDDKFEM